MIPAPLRILIVDDTALYRKVLADAFVSIPDTTVVGTVATGPLALARLAGEPVDLVLLDVFMPEMNGPEVLERIRRDFPRICVVMISGATGADAAITINALANGALDFIPKPQATSFADGMNRLRAQLQDVVRLVRIRRMVTAVNTLPARVPAQPSAPIPARRRAGPPPVLDLVLVGVSTGGPRTLQSLLPALPAGFRLPVVIVQHMPPVFTRTLAEQLAKECPLPVAEACDAEKLTPGRILIAPGGRHLELTRDADGTLVTRLTDTDPVNSCRPAVDVLFQSAARCSLRGVLSLILTGMGEDGANGVAALKNSTPTWSIAQDEATCVIYGMPQAVIRRELDDEVLPLSAIAPRLAELATNPLLTMPALMTNPGDLSLLSHYVAEACCIHLGEEKGYLFESRLGAIITQSGAADIPDFIRLARSDPTNRLRDRIIDAMTTHETYWFRDERPWAALRSHILPELASQLNGGLRTRMRILCAACSTGQEPYSLAMLIDTLASEGRLGAARAEQFEIIGTDVSAGTLMLATNGRYNQIEIIRGLSETWRRRYFTSTGPIWTIADTIRKRVSFKRHNLQDDLRPFGQFDLLLCRNVAIYFKADFKARLFDRLAAAIVPGGRLLLGGSESLLTHQGVFASETVGDSVFYRRKSPSSP